MSFPAIYVAVTSWHTSLLPTNLILSMALGKILGSLLFFYRGG